MTVQLRGIFELFSRVAEAWSVSLSSGIIFHAHRKLLVDIYDGDNEPMVFHGKTLTSKVPVREVCEAIAKYAFVTSPYPIIISAEIRCSVPQQDILAKIMHKVFGEALVSTSTEGNPTIDKLPSPEDLKGKVLVKVCVTIPDVCLFLI